MNTLFRMRDPEQFVECWWEFDFASPPVVVVFLPLATHEVPAGIDLAPTAHDRDASAFRDARTTLLARRQAFPLRDRQQREGDANPSRCLAKLKLQRRPERLRADQALPFAKEERIKRHDTF